MSRFNLLAMFAVLIASLPLSLAKAEDDTGEPIRVLLLDGHNPYHDWQKTSPILQHILRSSGRFTVDVATAPSESEAMAAYRPPFAEYDVVLSHYNDDVVLDKGESVHWSEQLKEDLLNYLREGGGFVAVHSANNAFTDWPEYNEICGLGGWNGRDASAGPYVYYKNDKLVVDDSPGRCGHHGPQHEYQVKIRDEHPIVEGLPPVWLHAQDELYDSLRGPAKNMTILATAYSDPEFKGTDRDEPMLMVLNYGKGRVFHTAMGHADYSMRCVGFITTLLRGTEWAATGEVTIPVPDDFPTADLTRSRD